MNATERRYGEVLDPVWLEQNWNRFQNPLHWSDFLKPNPDSWNHETSPGGGFIEIKLVDGDGQVSVETSDNLFEQFTIHNLTIKVKETSNGSWCMGIKGEMSGTVCVTFTWDMYIYIYIWVVYSLCFFCCLFIIVTWWYVWCIEWASGNQEEVHACLVTVWLFIISCYSLYKTTLGLLCPWFENNPHFHKYSMDFHV